MNTDVWMDPHGRLNRQRRIGRWSNATSAVDLRTWKGPTTLLMKDRHIPTDCPDKRAYHEHVPRYPSHDGLPPVQPVRHMVPCSWISFMRCVMGILGGYSTREMAGSSGKDSRRKF